MLLPLQGRSIAYDLIGPDTAPVIFMAHSLSSDSGMWAEQMPPLLAAGFRVLRVDNRGHGGSTQVAGDYTMSALAGDFATVLDALELKKVHYIGLSIGGMIGQAFAIEHGHRLHSAMWCDTRASAPADGAASWNERMAIVRNANSLLPLADATMDRWFTPAFKPRNPGRWKQIRDTVIGTTPAGYLGCTAAIQNFNFLPQLPALRLKLLVVCGAADAGTPPAANRQIAALVPGGRYEEISASQHFPNVEQPENFNRIMMDWMNAQRSHG